MRVNIDKSDTKASVLMSKDLQYAGIPKVVSAHFTAQFLHQLESAAYNVARVCMYSAFEGPDTKCYPELQQHLGKQVFTFLFCHGQKLQSPQIAGI